MKLKKDELVKFPDGSVLEYKKGTDKSVIMQKKMKLLIKWKSKKSHPLILMN